MTEFQPGDIVIASFPFSTQKGAKERPCLILAVCDSPQDYLAAYISSSAYAMSLVSAISIPISFASETSLKVTSYVRADKLSMLHVSVIEGRIGKLPLEIMLQVKASLKKLLAL